MKVLTIVGARPQFVKAAPVSRALARAGLAEVMIHTGQHYDENMSDVFFRELEIPAPAHHLGVGSGSHGMQTGRMLEGIEKVMAGERPDVVLVYGDTNSTLAGALAAAKTHVPVAHVEAGLRSFNRRMPEEVNRVLTDHVSEWLFCPTRAAVANLRAEGIARGVHQVGDVMYDAALMLGAAAGDRAVLSAAGEALAPKSYLLATVHRPENADNPERLGGILAALGRLAKHRRILLPLHPRTRQRIGAFGLGELLRGIDVVDPLGFLDMVSAEKNAAAIITDSGGVQKEAYFHGVPCVTTRPETEWVETVQSGWNILVDADTEAIVKAALDRPAGTPISEYGSGNAAARIAEILQGQAATGGS